MNKVSKALVTGGAGFIGSHIVDELISRGIETFVIDNLSTGSLENLSQHKGKKLHVLIGDVRDTANLLGDEQMDVVFHEAAIASVPKSVTDPMLVHDVNVNMTLDLMNYCVRKNVKRFVFASSAAVYGVVEDKAREEFVCRPYSPYGASKLCVENYLNAYYETYGLQSVALRYFNVYGPRQTINDYSGVITVFIRNLLLGQTPTIHGDGSQVRDFVFVKDIVQANMLAMESANATGTMFNVASGSSVSIKELLETLQKVTNTADLGYQFGPSRKGDVKFGRASIDKIQNYLGYGAKVSPEYGLSQTVDFLKTKTKSAPLSAANAF
ncbi:MAG: NAD-dependent epimerase/dehydratase family protein [Candidatus Nitrosotenuis sp.]|nr:MAG: NAD-dependent epimerase/dehydratase family protein [Candidatus Nitrosotenuis sp.]